MSIIGASGNNPFAFIQTPWQTGKSQSNATQSGASQGDAPSQTFVTAGPQPATGTVTPPAPTATGKSSPVSSGTFPRFDSLTLQTLLALQSAGS